MVLCVSGGVTPLLPARPSPLCREAGISVNALRALSSGLWPRRAHRQMQSGLGYAERRRWVSSATVEPPARPERASCHCGLRASCHCGLQMGAHH